MGFIKLTNIKKYLPKNIKIILSQLKNKNSAVFSLNSKLFPPKDLSDFYVWSPNFEKITFVAENIYNLIDGHDKKVPVTHTFRFFLPNGSYLKEYKYNSNEVFSEIKLPFITDKHKYISFYHFSSSDISIKKILSKNCLKKNLKISKQSRGYTLYHRKNNPISCVVHGNFGGISPTNEEVAKQRVEHIYTPVYKFEENNSYDLVFNNSTKNDLIIKAFLFNINSSKDINIPPMGTEFMRIEDYSGGISFESKLPICRPLIFKNPPPYDEGFDVLHG